MPLYRTSFRRDHNAHTALNVRKRDMEMHVLSHGPSAARRQSGCWQRRRNPKNPEKHRFDVTLNFILIFLSLDSLLHERDRELSFGFASKGHYGSRFLREFGVGCVVNFAYSQEMELTIQISRSVREL
ncbi:hypothetical protein Mapa_013507 [Marchantia paleacea]|nr:hypothetical protein Mapa_013507 [Marchantia paleacea]